MDVVTDTGAAGQTQMEAIRIHALGRIASGWPIRLPGGAPAQVEGLDTVDGRLYVGLQRCGDGDHGSLLLAVGGDESR